MHHEYQLNGKRCNSSPSRYGAIEQDPEDPHRIAEAAITPPTTTPPKVDPDKPAPAPVDSTFNVLFGYIPTEVLTLYVAVLAAVQHEGEATLADWLAFWIFLSATPIIVWLVFATKLKTLQKPLPLNFGAWPVWEMFAATVAFTAWAFALPQSPFTKYDWYSSGLSGVAVLVISTLLGLLAPLFQGPLST